MSKTLLNRLAMFEVLDVYGPMTITELSRRTQADVTVVSRTVAACEPQGWLVRIDGKVALGPRCTLLGYRGPIAAVIDHAENVVHALAGVTGLLTQAFGLVGSDVVLLAAAAGPHMDLPANLSAQTPVQTLAAGWAIAAQLDPVTLDHLLPPGEWPSAESLLAELVSGPASALVPKPGMVAIADGDRPHSPRTRHELETEIAAIRQTGFAVDRGVAHPSIHCIVVPWPQPGLPASLGCLGPPELVGANAELVRRALAAATKPGATARDIVRAAADAMAEDSH